MAPGSQTTSLMSRWPSEKNPVLPPRPLGSPFTLDSGSEGAVLPTPQRRVRAGHCCYRATLLWPATLEVSWPVSPRQTPDAGRTNQISSARNLKLGSTPV